MKREPLRPGIYSRFRAGAAVSAPSPVPRGWLLYGTPEDHGYVVTTGDGGRLLHSGST